MNISICKSNFQISPKNEDQFFSLPPQRRLSGYCSLICCKTLWSSGMQHHIMQYSRNISEERAVSVYPMEGAVCFCEMLVAMYFDTRCLHSRRQFSHSALRNLKSHTLYCSFHDKLEKHTSSAKTLYLPKNICLCPGMCNISEFLRHMAYLGFIFSLTFTCYCAGLCVAWRQRHRFQTYNGAV